MKTAPMIVMPSPTARRGALEHDEQWSARRSRRRCRDGKIWLAMMSMLMGSQAPTTNRGHDQRPVDGPPSDRRGFVARKGGIGSGGNTRTRIKQDELGPL